MGLRYNAEETWRILGERDPYYAVCADEMYRSGKLNAENRDRFFRTGETHVAWVMNSIVSGLDDSFSASRVLEYGCGVGRCLMPFARIADEVVGVDVSKTMLREAAVNCQRQGVQNVRLLDEESWASRPHEFFDLVHSYIVLQHIEPKRGEQIAAKLLAQVRPGGVAALHFSSRTASAKTRLAMRIRLQLPLGTAFLNLLKRRALSTPAILMHTYDLNRVLALYYDGGFQTAQLHLTDHIGHLGAMILSKRSLTRTASDSEGPA